MKLIVIDLETTGLDIGKDEILQISIIDGNYNTLMNEYCKPETIQEWKEAEAVHGITCEMVKDKLPFKDYMQQVQDLINGSDRIVGYNGKGFDLQLLARYGINIDYSKVYDLMLEVDNVYHKRFKLTELADFYAYEFKAHDSLEDAKATLYCYYKFRKEQSNTFFDYKSIDFIIEHSDKKGKASEIIKEIQSLEFCLDLYNRFVGVRTNVKKYDVFLLFNMKNNLVDSRCNCMDCLDGGNRLCKHVIASLICLKDNNVDVYQKAKEMENNYLKECKNREGNIC